MPRAAGHRDPRVVGAWLTAFAQGRLVKSMQMGSVAFDDLALSCLESALFDEERGADGDPTSQRERQRSGAWQKREPVLQRTTRGGAKAVQSRAQLGGRGAGRLRN